MAGPLPLSDVCPGHQLGMDLFAVEATLLIFFQFISAFAIDRPISAEGRSCEFAGLHPGQSVVFGVSSDGILYKNDKIELYNIENKSFRFSGNSINGE